MECEGLRAQREISGLDGEPYYPTYIRCSAARAERLAAVIPPTNPMQYTRFACRSNTFSKIWHLHLSHASNRLW